MKKGITFIITAIFSYSIYANDGVFAGSGSTLAPVKETPIELRKEILTFNIGFGLTHVDIDFTFWNPSEDLILTVGFVAPKGIEGVDEYVFPEIINFTTLANGKKLKYEVAELAETDYDYLKKAFDEPTVVFYFDITFKKGENSIIHSFDFYGGGDNGGRKFLPYSLKTGRLWANGQIDDFTLIIKNNREDRVIDIPKKLSQNINEGWTIRGEGKWGTDFKSKEIQNVYLKTGYLEYRATNFKPDRNLAIGVKNIIYLYNPFPVNREYLWWYSEEELNSNFSKVELRMLRNTFFALHGYAFNNKFLRDYFEKFCWYNPDPNKSSGIIFLEMNEEEQNRVKLIQKLEKQKK